CPDAVPWCTSFTNLLSTGCCCLFMDDISLYIDYIIVSSFCTPVSSFSLPLQRSGAVKIKPPFEMGVDNFRRPTFYGIHMSGRTLVQKWRILPRSGTKERDCSECAGN